MDRLDVDNNNNVYWQSERRWVNPRYLFQGADGERAYLGQKVIVDGGEYLESNGRLVPYAEVQRRTDSNWSGLSASGWEPWIEANKVNLAKKNGDLNLKDVGVDRLIQHMIARKGTIAAALVAQMQRAGYHVEMSYSGNFGSYRRRGTAIELDVNTGLWGSGERSLDEAADRLFEALQEYDEKFKEIVKGRVELEDQVLGKDRNASRGDTASQTYIQERKESGTWARNATGLAPYIIGGTMAMVGAMMVPVDSLVAAGLTPIIRNGLLAVINREGRVLAEAELRELVGPTALRQYERIAGDKTVSAEARQAARKEIERLKAVPVAPKTGLNAGEDVFAGTRGRNLSQLTNKEIGDLGESVATKFLQNNKYTDIFAVQNKSGNGLDIVARTQDGRLAFFEVKTSSVGKIGDLSPRQGNMTDFVRDILRQASTGTGRYKNLDVAAQNRAAQMLREFNAAPHKASGTVVGVDLLNEIVRVSPWTK